MTDAIRALAAAETELVAGGDYDLCPIWIFGPKPNPWLPVFQPSLPVVPIVHP